MTLYEIKQEILDCIDLDTGEVTDIERLQALSISRDEKLENIALLIKNLESDAEQIKSEETSLAFRRKTKEKKAESLRKLLEDELDGQKFETARVSIGWKSSESVNITDSAMLLEWASQNGKSECIKYPAPEIAKTEVKRLLKSGEAVPGCELVKKNNMQLR